MSTLTSSQSHGQEGHQYKLWYSEYSLSVRTAENVLQLLLGVRIILSKKTRIPTCAQIPAPVHDIR